MNQKSIERVLRKVVVIGGGKGGVGKSHGSQAAAAAIAVPLKLKGEGLPVMVEFERSQRQVLYYPGRSTHVPITVSSQDLRDDPDLALATFDPGFSAIRQAAVHGGRYVVADMGANLDLSMAEYLRSLDGESHLNWGEGMAYIAVTTGERAALEDAEAGIQAMREAMPDAACGVFVNDIVASDPIEPGTDKWKKLVERITALGVKQEAIVHAKRIFAARLLDQHKQRCLPLETFYGLPAERLAEIAGIELNAAIRARKSLNENVQPMQTLLRTLEVLP